MAITSQTDLLTQIRDLLSQPPDKERFRLLLHLINTSEDEAERRVGIAYAQTHLKAWPDAIRSATPYDCWDFLKERTQPGLPLARTMDFGDMYEVKIRYATWPPPLHTHTTVTGLSLEWNTIGAEDAQFLARSPLLKQVEWLDLGFSYITDKGLEALASSPYTHNIKHLNLEENRLDAPGIKALAHSTSITQLRSLDLSWNPLNLEGCQALSTSPHIKQLQRFKLNDTWPGVLAFSTLFRSPHLTALIHLEAEGNHIHTEGLTALSERHRPHLQHLSLHDNNIEDDGLFSFIRSNNTPALRYLDISSNPITPAGIHALTTLECPLETLHIGGTYCDRKSLQTLTTSPQMSALQALDLSHLEIAPKELCEVVHTMQLPALQKLDLSWNNLSDEDVEYLTRCPIISRLQQLELSLNKLTERGMNTLAQATSIQSLKVLELQNCEIGDRGLAALLDSPYLQQLEELELTSNELTHEGIARMCNTHLPALHTLDLSRNNIGDEGAKHIAESPLSIQLTKLYLTRNGITDRGAKALAQSPHLRQLKVLDIHDNALTEEGYFALAHSPYLHRDIVMVAISQLSGTTLKQRISQMATEETPPMNQDQRIQHLLTTRMC